MIIKVKICGIRTLEAAQVAKEAGADYLGFNFVPSSRRFIEPKLAEKIINAVRGKVKIIGIFQDAEVDYLNNLASNLGLDFAQLHGNEDSEYINRVTVPVIKSIKIDDQVNKIKADYLLLDRAKRGEGEMIDFKRASGLATIYPLFYAGGLNPGNVADTIRKVQPFAVDVASGIETNGKQEIEKIKAFIRNAKEANE